MASISRDAGGNVRILFVAPDKKWKAVRLGAVNKKFAESVKFRVEALAASAAARVPLDPDTAAWVGGIGDDLAAKLAAVGLVAERPKSVTLSGLLKVYADEKEAANKTGTRTNHRTITNDLIGFFGAGCDPRQITPERAKAFVEHLKGRDLAGGTVSRRARRARSIFAFAVKKKFVPSNPFADVKAPAALPADRKAFLPADDARRLIAAAPPLWRTVVALCRFGGMRCPSEVLMLKWSDVNFETGRMTIPSCKTEHIPGKEYRVAPIFAELRPYLDEAFELATPGEVYVVGGEQGDRYRSQSQGENGWVNCNLRTGLERLVRRAGLKPWPRLFNTMRASCETDLMAKFPISAVVEWIGHSAAVALKHYARVPDELFSRAAGGGAQSGARAAQIPAQTGADTKRPERTEQRELLGNQASRPILSAPVYSGLDDRMTPSGFEPEFWP